MRRRSSRKVWSTPPTPAVDPTTGLTVTYSLPVNTGTPTVANNTFDETWKFSISGFTTAANGLILESGGSSSGAGAEFRTATQVLFFCGNGNSIAHSVPYSSLGDGTIVIAIQSPSRRGRLWLNNVLVYDAIAGGTYTGKLHGTDGAGYGVAGSGLSSALTNTAPTGVTLLGSCDFYESQAPA